MWRLAFGYGVSNIATGSRVRAGNRSLHQTYVESGGETLVLDPLAPPADAVEVWKRLDIVQTFSLQNHVRCWVMFPI
jgi:hypothetical protein